MFGFFQFKLFYLLNENILTFSNQLITNHWNKYGPLNVLNRLCDVFIAIVKKKIQRQLNVNIYGIICLHSH